MLRGLIRSPWGGTSNESTQNVFVKSKKIEPAHDNKTCATGEDSDQPQHDPIGLTGS